MNTQQRYDRTVQALRALGFEVNFDRLSILVADQELLLDGVVELGLPYFLNRSVLRVCAKRQP